MSDVHANDLVSVNGGRMSGAHAGTRRTDAQAALFDTRGHEHTLSNIELQELSGVSRITERMAHEELSATEQGTRFALFQQHLGFDMVVQEHHQRRARDAVNPAAAESSARNETVCMTEFKENMLLGNTTASGAVRSTLEAKVYIQELDTYLDVIDHAMGSHTRGNQEKIQNSRKGRIMLNAASKMSFSAWRTEDEKLI